MEEQPGSIEAVAFSPDGRLVASTSYDGSSQLWDAQSGKLLMKVPVGGRAIAFSPDGRTLACAGGDIRLFDVQNRSERTSYPGHAGPVLSVALSPDGKMTASAGWDKTVRLWETVSGKSVAILTPYRQEATSVAFFPDGKRLISGSHDNDHPIRVWEIPTFKELFKIHLPTQKEVFTLKGHAASVLCLASLGPLLISGGADGTLRFWEPWTGEELRGSSLAHGNPVICVSVAQGGRRIVSGSSDSTILVWDLPRLYPKATAPPAPDSEEWNRLWVELSGSDIAAAYNAISRLSLAGEGAASWVESHFAQADPQRLKKLIADLKDEDLPVRDEAHQELSRIGTERARKLLTQLGTAPESDVERSAARTALVRLGQARP